MADLKRDRGQIILIAAFALAVTFIALAVVVNSAIFTGNLATRTETTAASDALEYRDQVEGNVGNIVEFVNVHNASSPTELRTEARESVENLSVQDGIQNAQNGRAIDVEWDSAEIGARLAQTDSTTFLNESGAGNWTLATGVDDLRGVRLNVTDKGSLAPSPAAYQLVVEESIGTDSWTMTVFDTGSDTAVRVENGAGNVRTCTVSVPGNQFTIDVSEGRVAGQRCPALTYDNTESMWLASGVSAPYTISYRNGDEIEGGYSLVIGDATDAIGSNFNMPPNSPFVSDAIYSADLNYAFRTADMTYETIVRVAPGEAR